LAKAKVSKTKTAKREAAPIRPVKETFTKAALINLIAEQNDIPRKTAVGVFATLESVLLGSVHPRGVGEFTLPGLLKVPSRPGEFHPEPLTEPDLILSHHPARAIARRLPPSAEPSDSSQHNRLVQFQRQ
jgi:hypothetical protein